jgi:hypothetical protein
MTDPTPSTLCEACTAIFQQNTASSSSHLDSTAELPHHGLEALAAQASTCHLCLTVFMSIDPDAYRNFQNAGSPTGKSMGFAWIAPIARDQARLKFRYVKPSTISRASPTSSADESKENRGPTPSSSGSKASVMLNWEETTGLVVELILMHPKCKSTMLLSATISLTVFDNRCRRARCTHNRSQIREHRVARNARARTTVDPGLHVQPYEMFGLDNTGRLELEAHAPAGCLH